MSLSRSIAALLLVTVVGACDDGLGPIRRGDDLVGVWVRYQPGGDIALPTINAPAAFDTLYLEADHFGIWSRTGYNPSGPVLVQSKSNVWFSPDGFVVRLWEIPEPCPACNTIDVRQYPAPFEIIRKDRDHIVVRSTPGLMYPDMLGSGPVTFYYERRARYGLD